MAEIKIDNLEAGQEACNTLMSAIQKLQATGQGADGAFNVLTQADPDLGTKFINELNTSITDIFTFLNDHIYPAAEVYFQSDNPAEEQENPDGSEAPPGGQVTPDGPSGSGHHGGKTQKTDPPDEVVTISPIEQDDDLPETVVQQMDTELEAMKLSELDGSIDSLIALAEQKDKKLDELVESDEYADDIKNLLLNSPYIPQSFKDTIKDMDSKTVRKYLEALLKGECPSVFELNPLNIGIVYNYLLQVAEENGITVEELLSDPKNTELLKDVLGKFSNVVDMTKSWEDLSAEDFQKNILQVYDGDGTEELPQEDCDVVRSFVDYISEETEIDYEELLTDTTYAETLKDAALQFGKACVFFSATSHFTDEGMRNNASQMFDGSNPQALGMDAEEVNSFKEEMETLAKEKNTTADKLLTDKKYADDVKEALKNSKSAEGVGSIFKKADSSVSQEVAKKLYDTKVTPKVEYEQLEGTVVDPETGKEETAVTYKTKIVGWEIIREGSVLSNRSKYVDVINDSANNNNKTSN